MEEEFEEIEAVERMLHDAYGEADMAQSMIDHAREDLAEIGVEASGQFAEAETLHEDLRGFGEKAVDFFFDKLAPEVGNMLVQKWHEGANEVAKALYGHADGFVLYGHNALKPEEAPSYDNMPQQEPTPAPEREEQLEM